MGRVLLDEAGAQSTFSTTLNKKSHASRHLLYGFDPVPGCKLTLVSANVITLTLVKTDMSFKSSGLVSYFHQTQLLFNHNESQTQAPGSTYYCF